MISAEKYRPAVNDPLRTILKKGSREYNAWWTEQYRRCIEGYTPEGGTRMSGAFYFYLNFCNVDVYDEKLKRRFVGNPFYRDQDHEYFHEIEEAEKGGYGIIVLKARRKGFSFDNVGLLLHEWSFYENSVCAIGSEKEHYVSDFRAKVMKSYNRLDPRFKLKSYARPEDGAFISGYKEKIEGEWVPKGFLSEMHFRVGKDENVFRGISGKYFLFEEGGEISKLKKLFLNSEECWREGSIQYGVPIIGGTANQISHEHKDFQEMFYDAKRYNLKPVFISAAKNYTGFFDFSTGKSNVEAATKDINRRAEEKRKDKLAYFTFKQEMPLCPEDAFVSLGTNVLNIEKINGRKAFLLANPDVNPVRRGRLEWKRTKDGKEILGSKPDFVEDHDGPFEIAIVADPGYQYQNVSAVDSYYINDEFEEQGSTDVGQKSKGSMYVYRRWLGASIAGKMPIAKYKDRPATKDIFCENCYKLAVFTDSQILVEYTDDYFLKWFDSKGAMRYIKERPLAADAPNSAVTNRYGIHMKDYQKNLLSELLQEYVENDLDNVFFISLLEDMANFGKKNTDESMAFGMCLIHDMDLVKIISKPKEEEEKISIFSFVRNANGSVTYVSGRGKDITESLGMSKRPSLNYDLD